MKNARFKAMTSDRRGGGPRVHEIIADAERPIVGLRVGVKNGGCAGMSYTMEFAESAWPLNEVVEDKGVRLLIDPKALLFLLGAQMDFRVDKLSSGFVFDNPNQTSACGCGESVAITPAKRRSARGEQLRRAQRARGGRICSRLSPARAIDRRSATRLGARFAVDLRSEPKVSPRLRRGPLWRAATAPAAAGSSERDRRAR